MRPKIPFLDKKKFQFKLICDTCWCSFFFCLDQEYSLLENFFQKIEIVCWSWNLELRLTWIWRIGWRFFLFAFCFVLLAFFFLFVLFFIFRWGTRHYMSLFSPSVRMSVAHHISGTVHHLVIILVHMCKMMISPGVFCFFSFFFSFWDKRAKNGPKCKVTITYITHHISGTVCQYDHDFWYTCVKWWYLQVLFSFSEIFIFWAVIGAKGQKIAQSEK